MQMTGCRLILPDGRIIPIADTWLDDLMAETVISYQQLTEEMGHEPNYQQLVETFQECYYERYIHFRIEQNQIN